MRATYWAWTLGYAPCIAILMMYSIFKNASMLVCSLLHHEKGCWTGLKLQCITYILGIYGKMAEVSVFQNFYHYCYFLSCLELIEIFQCELWEVETLVENVNVFLN